MPDVVQRLSHTLITPPRRRSTVVQLTTIAIVALSVVMLGVLPAADAHTAAKPKSKAGTPAGVPVYDPAAAALLPASIRSSKVINVGGDIGVPPLDYYKDGTTTLIGSDIDLGQAIAKTLGVKWNVSIVNFAQLVTGVASGQFDLAMGDIGDTQLREPQTSFVDYMWLNFSLLYPNSNPANIHSLLDICGKQVGFFQGGATSVLNSVDALCAAAGLPPENVITYADLSTDLTALQAGRVDGQVNLTPLADYYVKAGVLKAFPVPQLGNLQIGIAVAPSNTALQAALVKALKDLEANGTYAKILAKWGLTSLADKTPGVNTGIQATLYG